MTFPTLSAFQIKCGSVTVGAGTSYRVKSVTGLGRPLSRTTDVPRPLADGDFRGTTRYGSRTLVIEIDVVGASGSAAYSAINALSTAWRGSTDLYLMLPGWSSVRVIRGEVRRLEVSDIANLNFGMLRAVIEYYCPEPGMLSDVTLVGGAASATSTLTFPLTFPVTFGIGSNGLTANAVNAGDYTNYPIMRMYGPFTSATITRGSDGAYFTVGATVADGDYVTVDMDARTMTHSSGSNYRRYLSPDSIWLSVQPGGDTFVLTSVGASARTTHLEIDSRSVWLV